MVMTIVIISLNNTEKKKRKGSKKHNKYVTVKKISYCFFLITVAKWKDMQIDMYLRKRKDITGKPKEMMHIASLFCTWQKSKQTNSGDIHKYP